MQIIPKSGLKGLAENWRSDLLAAISVAFVALPLGLAVALASGFEPIAGIISAIVGGIVATLFRGSHLTINGPPAGLIAVILAAIASLDDGSGQVLNYVLAVFVVSGGIQALLGFLKLGQLADVFHPTIIRGILAGIGIIIVAKQIHLALGTEATSVKIIDDLIGVITHIGAINPFVASISLVGLILLVAHAKIRYKVFHFLPAPIWVLILSVPLVYAFNFFEPHGISFFGKIYDVGPDLLVQIPDNLSEAILFPNFSKIDTFAFWLAVASVTLVSTIITLVSSKAIDKLDPYKRRTDLNKDLIGIGLASMVSGAIGGLPSLTVIVRSTVNVNNHAKTKWSNFYHGLILILFIFILGSYIQKVPLAALAILLVYSGFKLASPRVFKQIYDQGPEQILFFTTTLVLVVLTDILTALSGGLLLALVVHFILSRVSIRAFFKQIFKSGSNMKYRENGTIEVEVKGVANFLSSLSYDKILQKIPEKSVVIINFSQARLVDLAILELTSEFQRTHESGGGELKIMGLEQHVSFSTHKLALRLQSIEDEKKMTVREKKIQLLAAENGWRYANDKVVDLYYETFYFFKTRPIEHKSNCISGVQKTMNWEIADVRFDEGAYFSIEEFETTVALITMPFQIPKFTMERKVFFRKYLRIGEHKDIDYKPYSRFSNEFRVKVENDEQMDEFLQHGLRECIEKSGLQLLESNGEAILVFIDRARLTRRDEYAKITQFIEEIQRLLV